MMCVLFCVLGHLLGPGEEVRIALVDLLVQRVERELCPRVDFADDGWELLDRHQIETVHVGRTYSLQDCKFKSLLSLHEMFI